MLVVNYASGGTKDMFLLQQRSAPVKSSLSFMNIFLCNKLLVSAADVISAVD